MKCYLCGNKFMPALNFNELLNPLSESLDILCSDCQNSFSCLEKGCQYCQKAGAQKICQDCQAWQKKYQVLLKNHAIYAYNVQFHNAMRLYKRYGDYQVGKALGALIQSKMPQGFDYYIPIPTSESHIKKRGFDTIYELFKGLVPLCPILKKRDLNISQGELNRQQRLATPQSFYLEKAVGQQIRISGKVLLLDDIYTTGRTLYHARDAIWQVFPDIHIESFTISR